MQKIMFNDQYELTKAVLEGRKTQTRRIIKCPRTFKGKDVGGFYVYTRETDSEIAMGTCLHDADGFGFEGGEILPRYKVGEIVAIAQSYKDLGYIETALDISPKDWRIVRGTLGKSKGWDNKMFVRAEACVHQIKITNVWIEYLQDISDEDCLAEGVVKSVHNIPTQASQSIVGYYPSLPLKEAADKVGWGHTYSTPQYAYAALIDKISGKGTWGSNPLVFAYEFELVK